MKSRQIFTVVLSLIGTAFMAIGMLNNGLFRPGHLHFGKNDPYETLWKRVDSLAQKGLDASALEVVNGIYEKAKVEKNAPQFVKAVIHRMKYAALDKEFSEETNIGDLEKEIQTSEYPIRPVLQSLLAEAYWRYYENHRWELHNRTEVTQTELEDVATWDAKRLLNASIHAYKASLANTDSLKRTKLELYDAILVKGTSDTRKWRATLYDFLAQRALTFFVSTEADVTQAVDQFHLNDGVYLKPYTEFVKAELKKPVDSLELKYYAIYTLQDLTRFHQNDSNPEALIDLELQRLDLVYSQSQNEQKDSLYSTTLKELGGRYAGNPRSTELVYKLASWYQQQAALYQPLASTAHKGDRAKAIDIAEQAIKKYPDAYGAKQCYNLVAELKRKSVMMIAEEATAPEHPSRVLVTYANTEKLYFRLHKITREERRSIFSPESNEEQRIRKVLALPLAEKFEQALPVDKDFNPHSAEVKVPALPYGYYILVASLTPDFKTSNNLMSFTQFAVSDLAMNYQRNDDGSYDVYVVHRQSGKVLPGVEVQSWSPQYDYTKRIYQDVKGDRFTTDAQGHFYVKAVADANGGSVFFEARHGKDVYYSEDNLYRSHYRPTANKTTTRSFFFLDRGIYRPGQTVYFKGIVLQDEGGKKSLKTKTKVLVVFYDVNDQERQSIELVTNEYGTVSGSFVIPSDGLTGQMRIGDENGQVYFSVEDYKRPKFEVTFLPVKETYQLNDEVTVGGLAKAYAGNRVDGAKVNYRITREVVRPYWWYWYKPYFSQSAPVEIASGTVMTNDTGGYQLKFKALPDPSAAKEKTTSYTYRISADVVDINGETHSNETEVSVGYISLKLSLDVPAQMKVGSLKPLTVTSTNLNNEDVPAKGSLSIYKLKQPSKVYRRRLWEQPDAYTMSREEYEKAFPNDLYADENNTYKWERGAKIAEKAFDTGSKNEYELTELKNAEAGVYLIEAISKDKNGEEVKEIAYISLFTESSAPSLDPQWFYVNKTQAEPGDTVQFIFQSGYTDATYFYQLSQDDKVLESAFIRASMNPVNVLIKEEYRGNVALSIWMVHQNRFYRQTQIITVPYSNKELDVQFETFRDKLIPGQAEEWKIRIKDKRGDKLAAEMLAGMYDASLDAFAPNEWGFDVYEHYYSRMNWSSRIGSLQYSDTQYGFPSDYKVVPDREYDYLNYFGMEEFRYRREFSGVMYDSMAKDEVAAAPAMSAGFSNAKVGSTTRVASDVIKMETLQVTMVNGNTTSKVLPTAEKNGNSETTGAIKARSNFNETAFFFPQLQTNEQGEVVIKFTIPESLTRWKFMGLAHTKDLKIGRIERECVTQKDLMVQPNAPRFFREGDKMSFAVKVSNLSNNAMNGTAQLTFSDALSGKDITTQLLGNATSQSFTAAKGQSAALSWDISIPEGYSAIAYKVVAKAGNFSDGEEMTVPVLTNRMLVTESLPLPIRGKQTKNFSFVKFSNQNNHSTTLRNQSFTLEYTANPAWYAVQALPYLMEYPYECAEQTFARYYANSLAAQIANSNPKIHQVFESWKTNSPESFLSNLEENKELKALMTEETPWVLNAKNETERKKRVALLFDLNRMSNELSQAMRKLQKMQASNGGWPWFEGMPDDWYITQHIVSGMGHLDHLGVTQVRKDPETWQMLINALRYTDDRLAESFERIKKDFPKYQNENHLDGMAIQYLYARSYFKDVKISDRATKAFEYFKKQEQQYWLEQGRYLQGMIALGLHRYEDSKTPKDILKSLKEKAIVNEEMGMYWKEQYNGFYWYQSPIETQALLIEAFDEVNKDTKVVDDLKAWLLTNKQTQDWKTTKATTEAIYALLLRGTDWLSTESAVDITLGDVKIDPKKDESIKQEAGTGYFKKTWAGSDIKPNMGVIKITKKDEGVSWGAVYWQYFEQLDKITPHETPLKLKKALFLQKNTASGPVLEPITATTALKPGDKVKVRIELRVDRDMEYVHMKDMRAAGFEPVDVLSGYRYQNGLGYYESTRDASTNFFFAYLNKGTHVFEYTLVVNQYGNFSNGITTIQSMYAPEFTSHSEGIRVNVQR